MGAITVPPLPAAEMPSHSELDTEKMLQAWLDQNQYTRKGILRYEAIFGKTWVSVGGESTTRQFVAHLDLKPGMKVLDIGCGIGGSAFYMARNYMVDVNGIDLSTNMIAIADDYRKEMEPAVKHRTQFYVEDALSMDYPDNFYDVVYSRDTILHIPEKNELFAKFLQTLKPGGRLLISDYCHGDQPHSNNFKEYGKGLEGAGFKDVQALDKTGMMMDVMKTELAYFNKIKSKFVLEFSHEDFNYIEQGWKAKQVRTKSGDQAWGLFIATK